MSDFQRTRTRTRTHAHTHARAHTRADEETREPAHYSQTHDSQPSNVKAKESMMNRTLTETDANEIARSAIAGEIQ